VDSIGYEPKSEQRGKDEIEPIAQRDRTPHPFRAFFSFTVDFAKAAVNGDGLGAPADLLFAARARSTD
jgi:hypothetical protein